MGTRYLLKPISRFLLKITGSRFKVHGVSMEPTYTDGMIVWVNSLFYRFRSPIRGDVVVLRPPAAHMFEVKRIIGLGSEEVSWTKGGTVRIDGRHLEEQYAKIISSPRDPVFRMRLTPGQFFLLGDNRLRSQDSREYGPILSSDIVGFVLDS